MISFIAGNILLYLFKSSTVRSRFVGGFQLTSGSSPAELGASVPPAWKLTSLRYYLAHNAELYVIATPDSGIARSFRYSPGAFSLDVIVWAIPMGVLLLSGYLVANQHELRSISEAVFRGSSVLYGYTIAAILGTLFVEIVVRGNNVTMEMGPTTGSVILLVGIVWPILFGGAGGVVSFILRESTKEVTP
ncbi:hypothetical protein [Halobacterium yunchengense]|uniref:hypothetical protein n=1 Tax=Halobacterium yunchengense TaxID=3108497 RepID=UPI0030092E07